MLLELWPLLTRYKNSNKEIKNKTQSLRQTIASLSQSTPKLLYLHHEWGGGVELYLQNKIKELKNDTYIFVIFYQKKINKINLRITFQGQSSSFLFDNFQELLDVFSAIKIDTIYINQISFFPDLGVVFDFIKQIKNKDAKTTMLMHDFSSICSNANLIKNDGSKCDIIDGGNSCQCNTSAGENLRKWQELWKEFLANQADEIICFSESSKQILSNIYPFISNKISIERHYVPPLKKANVIKRTQTINIATIGFLNKIKGCDIVEEMSKIIADNNLPVKIFVVGKFKAKAGKAIKVLGKYVRDDLPKIIEDNQIDLIFISSICPETFSYTAHEAMMMGVKTACFDLGAQAEYIGGYEKGLVISRIDAQTALDEIFSFVSKK